MRVWRFQHATVVEQNRRKMLSYYFDLQTCLHNCNRIACWVCGNAFGRFVVKLVKMCGFGLLEIALVMMFNYL